MNEKIAFSEAEGWENTKNELKKVFGSFASVDDCDVLIVPLFSITESGIYNVPSKDFFTKDGLSMKKIRHKRESNQAIDLKRYKIPIIFLCRNKKEIPPLIKAVDSTVKYDYVYDVVRDPQFKKKNGGDYDIDKAMLSAESVYKDNEVINFVAIDDLNFIDKINNVINYLMIHDDDNDFNALIKEQFYDTFIYYYNYFDEVWLNYSTKNRSTNLEEDLEMIQAFYNGINGITKSTHLADSNLFRSPAPFLLQELIDTKKYIEGALNGKKIKLLLLDNRSDNKFIKENDKNGSTPQSLCALLNDFGLDSMFEIQMLRNVVYTKDNGKAEFYKILDYKNGKRYSLTGFSDFKKDYEEFNFRWFKSERDFNKKKGKCKEKEKEYDNLQEYHENFINGCKTKGISINTYSDIVYQKIKSSHFILLDFFLDENDIYLAVDFIKDISEIKKKAGDYSTTWYFITSAVYDSVVKYSQSGLLAEYYESAVVNTGDDPTNKKRQIIFVYKLLTFIQSRLRSFKTFKDAIHNHMLNDEKEQGKGVCCVTSTNKNMKTVGCLNNCKKDDCLEKMQTHIKRYLTEYDNIWALFYEKELERDYKDIAELLDDTIKKFLWLPEADWQMVQHQIDYINAKLKILGENRKFSCKYINGEIEKRSEIY